MDPSTLKTRATQTIAELLQISSELEKAWSSAHFRTKREQLKAIANSISVLQAKQVAVPEQLRSIKASLVAEIGLQEQLVETRELVKRGVADAMKKFGFEAQVRRNANPAKKRRPRHTYTVTLSDLFFAGLLRDGQKVVHRGRNGNLEGVLRAPDLVEVRINGELKRMSPSSAANHLFGGSRNGWDFWSAMSDDGQEVTLATLRAQFVRR